MKKSLFTAALLLLASLSLGQLQAANIALTGGAFGPTGTMGSTFDLSSTTAPGFSHSGNPTTRINDGLIGGDNDFSTEINDFAGYNASVYNWVGISFSSTVTDNITSLNLYTFRWADGGWFSSQANTYSGVTPALVGSDLEEPEVQITTDGGTTWSIVSGVTTDYTTALIGDVTGGTSMATFTFGTPITGINGIRLAGYNGGEQHFLSLQEFQVNTVPEPSTYALLGLGVVALVILRRRALKA